MKRFLCGTQKGLLVFNKIGRKWTFVRDHFLGFPVSFVYVDPRNGHWWVSLAHKHWGHKMHRSEDKGETWIAVEPPKYPEGSMINEREAARLRLIWSISHGGYSRPNRLFVGTEPGGLFVSDDYGQSFQLVESLWNHPTRPSQWFGGGRDQAGIHTIRVHPTNDDHLLIGVSCAGVFQSIDGGSSWEATNSGLRADYLPRADVKAGHDPHQIEICRAAPHVVWQQNHCGVYRSVDSGQNWDEVTDVNGLGNYGFALAIDHSNPDRAWIIPATSETMRVAVNKSLFVCRTDDGGKSWQILKAGLPQENFYDIVLRHAFAFDRETLVFGTNMGAVFLSENMGAQWQMIGAHFPKINVVTFDVNPE